MVQDYERDLFFLLHDVARLMRVEADKRAKVHGMTRAQWGILLRLGRTPGVSQKELADVLEVEPISVARLVDRLEATKLVERRADEQDRRIWRLHLLPAGAALLTGIERQREELAVLIMQGLPAQVRDSMVDGLLRMKANILRQPPSLPLQPRAAATDEHPAASPSYLQAQPASTFEESA
jgi:DNA-binding MarR family transcriptional regulator